MRLVGHGRRTGELGELCDTPLKHLALAGAGFFSRLETFPFGVPIGDQRGDASSRVREGAPFANEPRSEQPDGKR
jgi:hypothetical protein